jgi:hypothetical protein
MVCCPAGQRTAGVRFELTEGCPSTVFKTAPFDRSGTPPDGHRSPPNEPSNSLLLSQLGLILSGAPNCFSTSGTSPWKFSRIASAQRSVTAVPFSVCTCSVEPSRR